MTTKTIRQKPKAIKVLVFIPLAVLALVGFLCGYITAPFVSGFKAGRKESREFFVLDDLEK